MASFDHRRRGAILSTMRWALLAAAASGMAAQAQGGAVGPAGQVQAKLRSTAKRTAVMGDMGLVTFDHSPFPYDGTVPETGPPPVPFLSADADGRLFHLAPRAGKLYLEPTYADRRSLLYIPRRFDPHAADACIVLFLHGNLARLDRDVVQRQRVPQQLADSRLDAVLVAPQLAVDAPDSSPGHFYAPGFLDAYLREAARHLATLSKGRLSADDIDALPVVIVAYSGGYLATAFSLKYALAEGRSRIAGVVLLDALFGEQAKFADWIATHRHDGFFVSAYSPASAPLNADLARTLAAAGIPVERTIPPEIRPGDVILKSAPEAVHNVFVERAWQADPLQQVLGRLRLAKPDAGVPR